ncbi:MAG: alpha/beta hydrolase family protein [Candidatus Nanopelagicales bacterium]
MSSSLRKPTTVMRMWDWSVPPSGVYREVVSNIPAGWTDEPRAQRTPPLLFIHGLAHGAWCFEQNWLPAAAAKGFASYAVSLRGHGGSGGGRQLGRTVLRDYVHDVMQTITELPQPPVIIGHSMGALIAQLVADRYSPRGLVLLTPSPLHGAAGSLRSIGKHHPAAIGAAVVGRTLPMTAGQLFPGLDESTSSRYLSRLGRESPLVQYQLLKRRRIGPVRCPVMVAGTKADALVRVQDVERTAAAYGVEPAWLTRADGSPIGHDVMLDSGWEQALSEVLGFITAQVVR